MPLSLDTIPLALLRDSVKGCSVIEALYGTTGLEGALLRNFPGYTHLETSWHHATTYDMCAFRTGSQDLHHQRRQRVPIRRLRRRSLTPRRPTRFSVRREG